ncbi:MAG TPA: sulfatase-like hydrolase/transferase, partial [bacterium]
YDRGFSEFHDYIDASKTLTGAAVAGPGEQIGVPKMALDQYLVSEESVHRKACLENEINHSIFAALERVSRPFFLWVHYMDTHYPYLPQMSHQRDLRIATISRDENFSLNTRIRENMPLSPDLLRSVQSLYDASVRQLDGKIEELLRFLRQRGWYDSSLIVFCADHGEEFQEHGDLQHKSKLYDELLRVPLLIKSPFAASVRRCEQLLSLIQLPPTILSFLEAENPFSERSVFRQNRLSPAEERKFIIAEASYAANGGPPVDHRLFNIEVLPKRFAYRDQFWKLIFDSTKPETLLHNLVNDPFEKTPICDPGFAAGCLEILEGHIRNQEKQRLRDRIARVQKKLLTTAAADAKVITSF